jgi:hypothetical protein
MEAPEGSRRMGRERLIDPRRDFGRWWAHGPVSTFNHSSPYSTSSCNNHEAVVSMARGHSAHQSDQRGADDRSRRRSRERSRSPRRPGQSSFRHQPSSTREHQAQPSRKELFPNRRPSSRERDGYHRSGPETVRGASRDTLERKGEERSFRGREDNGLSTSRREEESNPVATNDGHHQRKPRSRSPSPHKSRKRRRERSGSRSPIPNASSSRKPFAENVSKPRQSFSGSNSTALEEHRSRNLSLSQNPRKHTQRSSDKEESNTPDLFDREKQRNQSSFNQTSRDRQHSAKDKRQEGDREQDSDRQDDFGKKSSKKRRRRSRRSQSPREANPSTGHGNRERMDLPRPSRSPTGREFHSQQKESRRRSRDRSPGRSPGRAQIQSPFPRRSQSPSSAPFRNSRESSHQFHGSRGKSPRRKPSALSLSNEPTHHERPLARRSRSRSVQSMSGASDKERPRHDSPDKHNSNYRDRPYHSGPRQHPNSPSYSQYPHQGYQDDWQDRSWSGGYGRGR